jgi:hypothetical protein
MGKIQLGLCAEMSQAASRPVVLACLELRKIIYEFMLVPNFRIGKVSFISRHPICSFRLALAPFSLGFRAVPSSICGDFFVRRACFVLLFVLLKLSALCHRPFSQIACCMKDTQGFL